MPLTLDMELQDGIVPAGFLSCFDPVFPHTVSITPFWNSNVYSTTLQVESM